MQAGLESRFRAHLEQIRDEPVYVILGAQGSGTNLLGRLLVRIFNFSLMRDRSLVFNAAARLGTTPSQRAVAGAIKTITRHVFPSAVTLRTSKYAIRDNEPFAGLNDVLRPSAIRNGADLARIVYAYRAFSLGTTRMAIKSDDIWEMIDALDEVLPNRRVILITRDFRDNLVSICGKNFGPIEPICAAKYVKERITKYAAAYRNSRDRALHVKFSTLVNSPRQFVDDIARHFQLTPTADPDEVIAAFPFRKGKIDKWRALPPDQLEACEAILYDELLEFGYEPVSKAPRPPSRSDLVAAAVRDTIKRAPQKVRKIVDRVKSTR